MAAIEVNRQIEVEEAQKALSEALGSGYDVSVGSPSSLKVKRDFVSRATVNMSWSGGTTSFQVSPTGLIVLALYNSMFTTPKIREAIGRAFPPTAD
jgi:hypothetical protein